MRLTKPFDGSRIPARLRAGTPAAPGQQMRRGSSSVNVSDSTAPVTAASEFSMVLQVAALENQSVVTIQAGQAGNDVSEYVVALDCSLANDCQQFIHFPGPSYAPSFVPQGHRFF